MVKWKKHLLYIPSPKRKSAYAKGFEYARARILEKYTYSPFVEVKRGDLVCDVGAYIGEFSLAVADKANKILAIEPDPISSVCLRKNVGNLKNVEIYEKALWNRNTILTLKLAYDTADSTFLNVDSGIYKRRIKIQGYRLDTLFYDFNVDKIDFLKIDAEGAEPEVIKGSERILDVIEKIAIDCSPERFCKPTSSEVKKILDSFGFQTFISDEHMVYAWRK